MYSIILDKNNYFTGSYAEGGFLEGGINVLTLPPDREKSTCYYLKNDEWIFDKNRWENLKKENEQMANQEKLEEVEQRLFEIIKQELLDAACSTVRPMPTSQGINEKDLLIKERNRLISLINS